MIANAAAIQADFRKVKTPIAEAFRMVLPPRDYGVRPRPASPRRVAADGLLSVQLGPNGVPEKPQRKRIFHFHQIDSNPRRKH
jgi:hypothetical protein